MDAWGYGSLIPLQCASHPMPKRTGFSLLHGVFDLYFKKSSAKTSSFWLKKRMGRWCDYYLKVQIVFVVFGQCLCHSNLERDIVDTLCHASWKSDTTRPNKAGFLLHEGRVRRVGMSGTLIQSFWSCRTIQTSVWAKSLKGGESEQKARSW